MSAASDCPTCHGASTVDPDPNCPTCGGEGEVRSAPAYRSRLGLTLDAYNRLLEAQGGVCAICGGKPKTRRLHVDHDHKSGKIRGLLCFTCNRFTLGRYAQPWKLRAAADYLERGGV